MEKNQRRCSLALYFSPWHSCRFSLVNIWLKMMMRRVPGLFGVFWDELGMRKKASSPNSVMSTLSAVLFVILPCSASSYSAVDMYIFCVYIFCFS